MSKRTHWMHNSFCWLIVPVAHITCFAFIFPHFVSIGIQVCLLLFVLYVAACIGTLQGYGDDGRGCVRAAHVIACCHGSRSPCRMTCGGVGPQLFTTTREVTSLGETVQRLCGSKMLMGAQGQQVHPSCPALKWSLFEQLGARTGTHCTDEVCTSAVLLPGFSCTSLSFKELRRSNNQSVLT